MVVTFTHWIGFNLVIFILLAFELRRFYKNPHPIQIREALWASTGWIVAALLFNGWIYFAFGGEAALNFLTGYLIEKSLSVDNLFIFLLIFAHLNVPEGAKHQVLFYGVVGAIIMRALLIWGGIVLVKHFEWIFILFGIFLILSGIRFLFKQKEEMNIEKSRTFRWLQAKIPFTGYCGNHFWVKQKGRWMATPLVAALLLIETSDLIFALDSVPAIFGITTEPFIVYTSNIFAILGLRSLFFALEGVVKRFHYLHAALAFILIFIGTKMAIATIFHIPTWVTFLVLVTALAAAIGASLNKKVDNGNKMV